MTRQATGLKDTGKLVALIQHGEPWGSSQWYLPVLLMAWVHSRCATSWVQAAFSSRSLACSVTQSRVRVACRTHTSNFTPSSPTLWVRPISEFCGWEGVGGGGGWWENMREQETWNRKKKIYEIETDLFMFKIEYFTWSVYDSLSLPSQRNELADQTQTELLSHENSIAPINQWNRVCFFCIIKLTNLLQISLCCCLEHLC